MEIWKTIPEFDNYEASSLGFIRNKSKGTIVNGYVEKSGYRTIYIMKDKKRYRFLFHRLIYFSFIGEIPENLEIAHLDGNKLNNSILNLKASTPRENCFHRKLHGTECRGERIGTSKLTEEKVSLIRENRENLSQRKLAELFGVSHFAIYSIQKRKSWNHI